MKQKKQNKETERPIRQPNPIHIAALAPYEDRLLACLSFFRFKRKHTVQARHCLSMYLRQGESRIRNEVNFYAKRIGLEIDELMELIYENPEQAETLLKQAFAIEDTPLLMDEEDNLNNALNAVDEEL